jgi:glycine cleavage system H lipoate-binding protein
MRCPFLSETQVKYCKGSAIKKMIVKMEHDSTDERCTSSNHATCPSFQQVLNEKSQEVRCPYLQESLVQYCSASSLTKYVPYSESSIIRCGTDGHRYCDLFLSVAATNGVGAAQEPTREIKVDGVLLPEGLAYSTNHMWLDESEDGLCYVGVDAFLTQIFQQIDAINFLPAGNSRLQTVVLTVRDVDVQLVFPFPIKVTRVNSYLRADVQKLVSHPYSSGWLYEGTLLESDSSVSPSPMSHMIRGDEAVRWMKSEVRRLSRFIHDQIIPHQISGQPVMMDGGLVQSDFINHLTKHELLHLFNEFFSPYVNWRKAT